MIQYLDDLVTSPHGARQPHQPTAIMKRAAKVRLPRLCAFNPPFTCLLTCRPNPQEARDAQRKPQARYCIARSEPHHGTRLPSFRRLQAQRTWDAQPLPMMQQCTPGSCGTTATSPTVFFGLRHCTIVCDGPAQQATREHHDGHPPLVARSRAHLAAPSGGSSDL